MTTIKRINQTY